MVNDLTKEYVAITYSCGHRGIVMVNTITKGYMEEIEKIELELCICCESRKDKEEGQ